ncbi:hypothetical protein DFJ73DRAFT_492253 [Zopfochytrium polystomum]|nr:hypothetical protein DFJ73DRAFT_492253 [Zopfochytrium polystomum]
MIPSIASASIPPRALRGFRFRRASSTTTASIGSSPPSLPRCWSPASPPPKPALPPPPRSAHASSGPHSFANALASASASFSRTAPRGKHLLSADPRSYSTHSVHSDSHPAGAAVDSHDRPPSPSTTSGDGTPPPSVSSCPPHLLTKCWQCGAALCSPSPTCGDPKHDHGAEPQPSSSSADENASSAAAAASSWGCGAVQPVPQWLTFFDVFGLVPEGSSGGSLGAPPDSAVVVGAMGFDVDVGELKQKFLKVQQAVHPDTHSGKSERERMYSDLQSAFANKAYQALRDPLTRAKYILRMNNVHIEEGEKMDSEFLAKIMMIWEEVEEASSEEEIAALKAENQARIDATVAELAECFRRRDLTAAKKGTLVLQYWVNLKRNLNDVVL